MHVSGRQRLAGTPRKSSGIAGVAHTDYHENKYAAFLDRLVRPGVRWLDLGAGSRLHGAWIGASQEQLAQRAGLLVGTDLHGPHMKSNVSLTCAVLSHGQALPFRSGSFDMVSANMVVEHLEHPETVFKEVARLLAPGGVFIISTPNRNNPIVLLSSWVLAANWRRLMSHKVERRDLEHIFPTYYRCNTEADLKRTATAAGFRIRELNLFSSIPFSKHYPGLLQLEGGLIWVLRHRYFRGARSNMIAVLERAF